MPKKRADGEGTIRKRADGRWEARYTDTREIDPRKRQKSIINKSQKVVVEKLKVALAEIDDGVPLISKENPTVTEWFNLWVNEYAINNLRDTTFEAYRLNIQTYINPVIGSLKIKDLTGLHIQRLYNQAGASKDDGGFGLKPASIIKIKHILSGALKQAITNRLIRTNPLLETTPPKLENPDIRILKSEEKQQFTAVLPFFNTGNMFEVKLATGMRIGELCALDKVDIDRENKLIHITKSASRRKDKHTGEVGIKVGPPKTKHSVRKIPLLPSVEVILDRQEQLVEKFKSQTGDRWTPNTLVFPTDTGRIHALSGLRSSLGRILKRAGLPHMSLHALRHTYATNALNSGVAAQNVARLLGHKDGATTLKYYAHYINTEALAQLKELEEQNVKHLGLTADELSQVVNSNEIVLEKNSVAERIDEVISRAKNQSPKKGIDMVLQVCEDILCQSVNSLAVREKDMLLGALSQYTALKRHYAQQGNPVKAERPTQEERH